MLETTKERASLLYRAALAPSSSVPSGQTGNGAPTRGAVRATRAASFGVAVLTIAVVAHVLAGGALPSMIVLALLAVPVTVMALVLTSRRCGPVVLLASLAGTQLLLHEALMVFAAQGPGEMSGAMSAHSASAMGSAMGGVPMSGAGGWSVTMTAAHVVATLLTALVLARGERALWQLVERILPTLPCIPRLLACGPRMAHVLLSVPALRPSLVSGGSGLRGPPAAFVATAQGC